MLKESEIVEFKKSTAELDKGIESMTAILNKHGRCELYFGVNNDGSIAGQEVSEKTLRNIGERIRVRVEPQLCPIIEEKTSGTLTYIVVRAKGETPPYSSDGRYYIRVADSDEKMSQSTLRRYMCNQEMILKYQTHSYDEMKSTIYDFFGNNNLNKQFRLTDLLEFFIVYEGADVKRALSELYHEEKLRSDTDDSGNFEGKLFFRTFPVAKPCKNLLRV